jgi:cysteine desulfurase
MHANNEVGTIQPVDEITRLARESSIIVHTDAAQSIGKIPVNVKELGVDLLSLAGHKLYAPKGIGALFIKESVRPETFIQGAGQESGKRAGTENVLEIVGLGKACKVAGDSLHSFSEHMLKMRDLLYDGLKKGFPQVRLNGHLYHRLPNTLSISFMGLEADRVLAEIGPEVAASAGAACHSGRVEISHVLEAMEVPVEWARGTIRFSTGRMTTPVEIDRAVRIIVDSVKRLRG